jgi:hypothetical protein
VKDFSRLKFEEDPEAFFSRLSYHETAIFSWPAIPFSFFGCTGRGQSSLP